MATYSIKDLETQTGLSSRVIRDYIVRGFIPGPESRGRNARYTENHLLRLKCLIALRKATPPAFTLDMLGDVLNSLSNSRIRDIALGKEEVQAMTLGGVPNGNAAGALTEALTDEGRDSALAGLVRRLEDLVQEDVHRRATHDTWVSVQVTPDIEIRARNLGESDRINLERLADLVRTLLQSVDVA